MTEACCINAIDYGGNYICTLDTLQKENIGTDICYTAPEMVGTRAFDYITYTDKCGCCCRLDGEREILINTFPGEIKTFTPTKTNIKWSEIFGANWYKTIVRYKTDGYPISPEDGTLVVEETQQNQYSTTGYSLIQQEDRYYKIYALDGDNCVLGECCGFVENFRDCCFGYTGTVQSITLNPGTYKLQVWGASGGVGSGGGENMRGLGGYSEGCLTFTSNTTLYIYVGQGGAADQSWKFNGGAPGQERGNGQCASGGGGTDISLCGGAWDSTNHWYSRIIVAGGGGATGEAPASQCGGHGGGCSGTVGGSNHVAGGPGTQTSAGGNYYGCSNYVTVCAATFGKGGTAYDSQHNGYDANGGGGGWYGGGGGGDDGGGGGGSGYVFTSATVGNYPSGRIPTSEYYLTNAYSCVGDTSFPSPSGGTETGHSGNGCVKISSVH